MTINPVDIKVDVYKKHGVSTWLGNSYVAVRVTHLPTGIYAESEKERSLHKNRAKAIELLKEKLNNLREHPQKRLKPGTYEGVVTNVVIKENGDVWLSWRVQGVEMGYRVHKEQR